MKLNVLDLFSGIGGFSLGLESTGYFKTIAFVEKDKFCQRVLQKNFPGIPIEDEIRNVKGKEYKADVVTGGFPCQPFSVAGKRKGTTDDRYLWDEMLKVITEVKPRWVVGENVQGIINIDNGLVLRQVQTDLESEGFQVQCFLIPASGIGAWHRRNRVWIVAANSSKFRCGTWSNNREERQVQSNEERKFKENKSEQQRWESRSRQESNSRDLRQTSKQSNNVSNPKHTGPQNKSRRGFRELEKEIQREKETRNKSTLRTSSSCSDVSHSNTGFSIGENKAIQARGNTSAISSKDVSNSKSKRSFSTSQSESGIDEQQRLDNDKKRNRSKIRSNSSRCSEQNVSNSNSKRLQGSKLQSNNKQTEKTEINTNRGIKKQQTWWQTESKLRRVPDGICTGLDKDRANRIKSLGNSIVPQIAHEIGKAILAAEDDKEHSIQGKEY